MSSSDWVIVSAVFCLLAVLWCNLKNRGVGL